MVTTPKVDNLVLLVFSARSDDPFVIGNVYGDQDADRAPIADSDSIRISRNGASIDIQTTDSDDTIIQLTDRDADADSKATTLKTGIEINVTTGDIVVKNKNGHGIEIPASGEVTIYGSEIDLNTAGSATFNQ
jgi:hypothetical protein